MNKKYHFTLPIIFALVLCAGMLIGVKIQAPNVNATNDKAVQRKFDQILGYIDRAYVDTPYKNELVETGIASMLESLDPFSVYIPANELQHANEQLEGNFQGIGVEFNIISDTVTVVHPIPGGPSAQLGIRPGDKIVKVEKENIAGIGIKNSDVIKLLKGLKNTSVTISIKRKGLKELIDFSITRDDIKIESILAVFMVNTDVGYIKVARFSSNTADDFETALNTLVNEGMKSLIIDLRGNPGGYLGTATKMADMLLPAKELIVYTEGRKRAKESYYSTGNGIFSTGKIMMLIDEGSASASEILAGAMQDLDRATLIGTQTYGKGLVQEPIQLKDGSQLRLTVARYYTPSGRCIQKPYEELRHTQKHTNVEDSSFTTKSGRIVSSNGGIHPDVEILEDSFVNYTTLTLMIAHGVLYNFCSTYLDANRDKISKDYKDVKTFYDQFPSKSLKEKLKLFVNKDGVVAWNETISEKEWSLIELRMKAFIGRGVWHDNAYYYILSKQSNAVQKALELLQKSN